MRSLVRGDTLCVGEPWCSWVLSLSLLQPAECSRQTGGGCAECRGVACRGVPLNKHSHPQRCTKVVRRESLPSSRFGLLLDQIREFGPEHAGIVLQRSTLGFAQVNPTPQRSCAARIPAEFTFWPISRSHQGVWPRACGDTVHFALFPHSVNPLSLPAEFTFWPISRSNQGV